MEVVVAALIAVLRRLGIWEGLGSRCCCPPPPRSHPPFRHLRLSPLLRLRLHLLLCPPNRIRGAVARLTRQLVAFLSAVLVELVHADAKFVEGTHRVSDGHVQSSGVLSVLRAC